MLECVCFLETRGHHAYLGRAPGLPAGEPQMSERLNRFLGDTPARTAVKLAVISLVVGVLMAALNWTPVDFWYAIRDFAEYLYRLGFETFGRIGIYFVWGAMVVIPVFIVLRLAAMGRR